MLSDTPAPYMHILGALSGKPSFLEMVGYQVNGLVVVFTALGSIWLLLELIGSFFKRAEVRSRERARAMHASAATEPGAPASADADLPTIAVIAAAVHHVVGRPHRIVAVTPELDRDWAREGRRQIFSSHQVR